MWVTNIVMQAPPVREKAGKPDYIGLKYVKKTKGIKCQKQNKEPLNGSIIPKGMDSLNVKVKKIFSFT